MTRKVPNADNVVTGLLNNRMESHIKKALFAVLATLQYITFCFKITPRNIYPDILYTCKIIATVPMRHGTDVVHKYISSDTLKVEEYSIKKKCRE